MKKLFFIFVLIVLHTTFGLSQTAKYNANVRRLSADEILQKVSDKLASIKTIKYKYHQEYNYASEAYLAESNAESFLEFTLLESNIGLKFTSPKFFASLLFM